MTDRDRRVGGCTSLDEHHAHRLSDDFAAAQDDGVSTSDLCSRRQQQLLATGWRTWQKPWPALDHQSNVFRMKTVDIFDRRDGVEHRLLVDLRRQWQLHQNAVRIRIGVQFCDECQKLVLSCLGREPVKCAADAGFLAGSLLVPHVNRAGRILANEDGRQMRSNARIVRKRGDFSGELFSKFGGDGFAVDDGGTHSVSPVAGIIFDEWRTLQITHPPCQDLQNGEPHPVGQAVPDENGIRSPTSIGTPSGGA